MSNREYKSFLDTGLPKRPDGKSYSPTAYNIYRTICYRYYTEKGYAYPGEELFMRASGVSRQSVHRALKELLKGGVITQWKKGYRGQRAEFIPVYHLQLLNSVKPPLRITEEKESSLASESDNLDIEKGKENTSKGTSQPVAISILSNSKSSKENLEDYLNFIPISKRPALSKELTKVLEELIHKGTSFKVIEDHFYGTNWEAITIPSGFVLKSLTDLNARPVKYSREFPPPYCGECHETERAFIITDKNGEHSNACKKCNWFWVNKSNGY